MHLDSSLLGQKSCLGASLVDDVHCKVAPTALHAWHIILVAPRGVLVIVGNLDSILGESSLASKWLTFGSRAPICLCTIDSISSQLFMNLYTTSSSRARKVRPSPSGTIVASHSLFFSSDHWNMPKAASTFICLFLSSSSSAQAEI